MQNPGSQAEQREGWRSKKIRPGMSADGLNWGIQDREGSTER